jgi:hypothetical protein
MHVGEFCGVGIRMRGGRLVADQMFDAYVRGGPKPQSAQSLKLVGYADS